MGYAQSARLKVTVAACQDCRVVAEDLSRNTQSYAGLKEIGCCGVTNVVHVQAREPYLGGQYAPGAPVFDRLTGHPPLEHQALCRALGLHAADQRLRIVREEQNPWRPVLGYGRKDLPSFDVNFAPTRKV